MGGETSYQYDINGNRTQVKAPNGATTKYEYDNHNQLIKEISPDRGSTTYAYDKSGNPIQITDANGNIKTSSYDLLNRKTGENWTNHPDLAIAYQYDTCRIGSLCKTTDKSGSTELNYDNEGKVTQKDNTIEGTTLSLKYSYDDNDKLQSITYPSGKVISYTYNTDKLKSIAIDSNPLITNITYNAANQLTGWTWNDDTNYTKTYDTNGRLKTFPLGNNTRTLNYDKLGNITGWTDTNSTESKNFQYDQLSRLISYKKNKDTAPLESQAFNYDANGNRLELIEDSVQTIYSILENSNKLSKVDQTEYQYDNNGNIINDGEHTYHYDARNRLTQTDSINNYLYNANNMRVKKTTQQETTLYGWENDRIFAEYDQNGTANQETIYFGSTPIALLKDDQIYKIYADQIDTPRIITNQENKTLWSWNTKPFGETQPNQDVDKDKVDFSYNLRFPGQYFDKETNKHYNYNRDYNPLTGRYIQSDPIGLDGGMSAYEYVKSHTLLYTDESGLIRIHYGSNISDRYKKFFQQGVNIARQRAKSNASIKYYALFGINISTALSEGTEPDVYYEKIPRWIGTEGKLGGYYRSITENIVIDSYVAVDMAIAHILIHELGHWANDMGSWFGGLNPDYSSVVAPFNKPNPNDDDYGYAAEIAVFNRFY